MLATRNCLPRWVQPEPYEAPHGCILRLAECNGLPGTREVRQMTGLSVNRIRVGRDLEDLAIALNCDVKLLKSNATHVSTRGASVGGQYLRSRSDIAFLGQRRACPACLAESPYHRVWWDWSFVSTCPFHNCILTSHCSCGSRLTWEDGSPLKCRSCDNGDVRQLTLVPANHSIMAADRWAIDRFIHPDREDVNFLDAVSLGTAIELMARIGALDLGGYCRSYPAPSDLGVSHVVRARGYHLVKTGAVDMALERAYAGYIAATRDPFPSLTRMYGWFYPWFLYSGGPRLSTALADIILRNASGKIQVTRRAFPSLQRDSAGQITLSEAADMAKVRTATMRKLLAAEGLIRQEKRKGIPVLVERANAERIAQDIDQALTLTSLAPHLGLGAKAVKKLARAGVLPTWVIGGIAGQHTYLFRKADISAWMDHIIGDAPTVDGAPCSAICLADAPRRYHVGITVLVRALQRRELHVVGLLRGNRDFSSALVNRQDMEAYSAVIVVRE